MREIRVLSAALNADSIDLLLIDTDNQRVGIEVANAYTVTQSSETWGEDVRRIVELIEDLAEEVHTRWKREPKPEQ